MSEARKLNPNDVPLMMSQANIYIRLGDNDKLAEIFKEALEKDFKPISDMRASGLYRMEVAKNLLEKCCAEIKQKKLIGVYV